MTQNSYILPGSAVETETVTISAFPKINNINPNQIGLNSTNRQVTVKGNFLFVDNVYLSAADNTLFNLSVIYMDYFTTENLLSLKYTTTTIQTLTALYPPISCAEVTSFVKATDSRIFLTLPSLSSFNTGDNIAVIIKNDSGYSINNSILTV